MAKAWRFATLAHNEDKLSSRFLGAPIMLERPVNRRLNFYHSGDQGNSPRYHLSIAPPDSYHLPCKQTQQKISNTYEAEDKSHESSSFKAEILKAIYATGTTEVLSEISEDIRKNFDTECTGLVSFAILQLVLQKHKLLLESSSLRLLAMLYLYQDSENEMTINSSTQLIRYMEMLNSLRAMIYSEFTIMPNEKRNFNDTQYQRELEYQLKDKINGGLLERLRSKFQQADTMQRQTLSPSQIREICFTQGLVIDDNLFKETFLRLKDRGCRQYNWQEFLVLIEKVQPSLTGLPIRSLLNPEGIIFTPAPNWPFDRTFTTSDRQRLYYKSENQPANLNNKFNIQYI